MPDKRNYGPQDLPAGESALARYRRLIAGPEAGNLELFLTDAVLGLAGGLPGGAGIWLRSRLYSRCFAGFDKRAYLGRHVTLRCPRHVELAAGVVIDDFAQLVATSTQRPALRIGAGSFVRSFAMLNAGPPEGFVHIGAGSSVGQGTIIYGHGGVTVGNNVMIAGQGFIVASSHNTDDPGVAMAQQGFSARGITIEDNVWIGAGARILDGVTIGAGAIVGANAVVNRDVAAGTVVGGVPARVLNRRPAG